MGKNPRVNGHNLSRLTISEGKRAEPRLIMAHPTWRAHRLAVHRTEVAIVIVLLAVVAIALAGRSL